jgi:hypothetical protein
VRCYPKGTMKMRKFFHIIAITFSSLASMVSHGHAKPETSKQVKKSSETKLHKAHSKTAAANDTAVEDPPPQKDSSTAEKPPLKLDPALMATAERFTPPPVQPQTSSFSNPQLFKSDAPSVQTERYPWRKGIVTTTFWVGEEAAKNNPVPNDKSSWDTKWAENYGGTDTPDRKERSNYLPAKFVPRQNPFYIALPYNDKSRVGHKPEASKVIPWFNEAYQGPGKSVLKGRWIAIRYKDKVAYAQWEDCGPFRTDHWEYVFGNERPKPNLNKGAGLDVSPAVRDYLGMNDTDVTDWRFVDFDEVPNGPWAMHGDNNTFVQNKRKAESAVAMETKASRPVSIRE